MINDIIIICMILLGFALFVRFGRFCRGLATVLLWCAAQCEGAADSLQDLGPHVWRAVQEMREYQRRQARAYLAEAASKR